MAGRPVEQTKASWRDWETRRKGSRALLVWAITAVDKKTHYKFSVENRHHLKHILQVHSGYTFENRQYTSKRRNETPVIIVS